jgi:hypothetical protein
LPAAPALAAAGEADVLQPPRWDLFLDAPAMPERAAAFKVVILGSDLLNVKLLRDSAGHIGL